MPCTGEARLPSVFIYKKMERPQAEMPGFFQDLFGTESNTSTGGQFGGAAENFGIIYNAQEWRQGFQFLYPGLISR